MLPCSQQSLRLNLSFALRLSLTPRLFLIRLHDLESLPALLERPRCDSPQLSTWSVASCLQTLRLCLCADVELVSLVSRPIISKRWLLLPKVPATEYAQLTKAFFASTDQEWWVDGSEPSMIVVNGGGVCQALRHLQLCSSSAMPSPRKSSLVPVSPCRLLFPLPPPAEYVDGRLIVSLSARQRVSSRNAWSEWLQRCRRVIC